MEDGKADVDVGVDGVFVFVFVFVFVCVCVFVFELEGDVEGGGCCSRTVTEVMPFRVRIRVAANPAAPAPMTATFIDF